MTNTNQPNPTHFETLYPAESRKEEISKILKHAREGNSSQIISLPGAGRSNLLGLLAYNHEIRQNHLGENTKWFHFVLSNFSEIKKRPIFDVTKFIFLNLIDSLKKRGLEEEYKRAFQIFKESLEFNDELVLFQGLKNTIDILSIEKELTVVFLFDRFEDFIPTVEPRFFTNLRVLRDRAKYRFSVVFSTNKPLEDIIDPEIISDFYQFVAGNIIYLSIHDKPGLDFRVSYIEKVGGKKIDSELLDMVMSVTAGHANFTRLAFETITNQDFHPSDKNDLLEFLLNQKSIKSALADTWKTFTPEEQQYLRSIINQKENVKLDYLENIGIIKNGTIQVSLFEEFIKKEENHILSKNNQEITFDTETKEIKKGDIILSDSLTHSEFRLLRYFIQNNDKVIERDEIIDTVWKNSKSTAGVTDQALDQLIFRLRKKIEDNPNIPSHLQTVKGRGYRFVP